MADERTDLTFTVKVDSWYDPESIGWYMDDALRVLAERIALNLGEDFTITMDGILIHDPKEGT
jgi:hypothetical protein